MTAVLDDVSHVLVIEDDPDQRELLSGLLSANGYLCTAAKSLADARLALTRRSFDAVVTDYELTDGHSIELYREGALPPNQTIVVTGRADTEMPTTILVLRKPIEAAALLDALAERAQSGLVTEDLASSPVIPPEADDAHAAGRVRLCLYYNGSSPYAELAKANLHAAVSARGVGPRVDIELVDLELHPERAEAAELVLVPTLVRYAPAPERRVVGDLSEPDVLDDILDGVDV